MFGMGSAYIKGMNRRQKIFIGKMSKLLLPIEGKEERVMELSPHVLKLYQNVMWSPREIRDVEAYCLKQFN